MTGVQYFDWQIGQAVREREKTGRWAWAGGHGHGRVHGMAVSKRERQAGGQVGRRAGRLTQACAVFTLTAGARAAQHVEVVDQAVWVAADEDEALDGAARQDGTHSRLVQASSGGVRHGHHVLPLSVAQQP